MKDDVVENADLAASRPVWAWLKNIGALLLAAWVVAGCFMEGEDNLDHVVPWLIVLGGGMATERLDLACQLFAQDHGHQGVVLTGGSLRRIARDTALLSRCGIPSALVHHWSDTVNSFEEMTAVAAMLKFNPATEVVVVSNSLHMPRLRYLRDRLALNGRVYLRECPLTWKPDPAYLLQVAFFWLREPLAYVFYRWRY